MAILLITPSDITTNTNIGGNVDEDKLNPCILDAQNSKIKELLGDSLYTKIETDFSNDDLSGNYLTLYNEFIKPILIHQSAFEYLLIGSYTVANGGIYKHVPANGTPVESDDIKRLLDNQRLKVEMYIERAQRWLFRVRPTEYNWYYENIVNPIISNQFNFDILGNNTDRWQKKPDNRMDNCFGN